MNPKLGKRCIQCGEFLGSDQYDDVGMLYVHRRCRDAYEGANPWGYEPTPDAARADAVDMIARALAEPEMKWDEPWPLELSVDLDYRSHLLQLGAKVLDALVAEGWRAP